jgi:hypothetical protein
LKNAVEKRVVVAGIEIADCNDLHHLLGSTVARSPAAESEAKFLARVEARRAALAAKGIVEEGVKDPEA